MSHEEYWKEVCREAHIRLHTMFTNCHTQLADIVYDDNGIDSFEDAQAVLAWAMRHADSCEEKACAILSITEIVHAHHELLEHKAVS